MDDFVAVKASWLTVNSNKSTPEVAGQRVSNWDGTSHAQIQGQYYWGGKPMGYYEAGVTHFQHQDWMGNERTRTTYNGAVEGTFTSLPFGDGLATTSGTDTDAYHFALLDHDYATDTEHAQFRQYNSAQGHWMRPDPYTGSYDVTNPQSFNRYTYALNNPLSMVDPAGLDTCITYTNSDGTTGEDCYDETGGNCDSNYTVCTNGGGSGSSYNGCVVNLEECGPPGGSGGGTSGGGGGGTSAPSNGTDFKPLFCLGDALKSNGLSLALDAVGLIPEGGAVSAAFSLFHGAAGVSNGTNILARFQMGAGLIGTASSSNDGNWLGTATGVASIGAALGKAAPVYGQVLSGISLGIDAVKTYQAQSACVDSGKYD